MKSLFLLFALLLSSFLMAQNIEKSNTKKHASNPAPADPKGYLIWENFEDLLMPPAFWQLQQGPTPETWDTATFDPSWGSAYVHCMYDESLAGVQNEYLITNVMNMSTFANVSLNFYFQFSKYWGIAPYDNYDLIVLASTDSAQTFTDTLWTELSTDTSTWNSFDWVFASVDLSAYIGEEKFALAFVYSGYDGAEAAIDMVSVETVGGINENTISFNVYPNPANEMLLIETFENGLLSVCDLQGRAVMQKNIEGHEILDVSMLQTGTYFVVFRTEMSAKYIPLIITR
ncbi:MAG: choice-of-anchor J domain-containing protein [Bacteroidales bacterium]|jgi:hypothetical protein|nr:choice-of-anchor J domain-containing protein [Bacteroidales bacterium]